MIPKILTIDDDPAFNMLIKEILTQSGFDCRCHLEPNSFLDDIKTYDPDLCLIDINLDVAFGAGFQLVKAIRSQMGADLPLIIVSRRNSEKDISYALEIGAYDYVTKPIDDALIISKVKMHLTSNKIAPSELPYYAITEGLKNAELTMGVELEEINEYGIRFKSEGLILKGTQVKFCHAFFHELIDKGDHFSGTVVECIFRSDTRSFSNLIEFNPEDEELLYKVKNWIASKA